MREHWLAEGADVPYGTRTHTLPDSPPYPPCLARPDRCMAAMPWGMVIVDESHNLRTTNSREADSPHTEACVAAVARARRAVLLSGTPSLSRPYDLYRQVRQSFTRAVVHTPDIRFHAFPTTPPGYWFWTFGRLDAACWLERELGFVWAAFAFLKPIPC
jgi:hypothetical protein